MSAPLPETLAAGRFQLLDVLGEGGMATVYRAFDRRLQRYRAIKILAPDLAKRESLRKRFLSEAQTMATLEESRVVRVFDMGDDDGRVYIVMELVEGGSLLDRVNSGGPLPPQLATQVGLQLAESLHAAHVAGVIHRDIKPHNILLTRSGEVRITDFGIAQVQSEDKAGMTRTGAVMGTWGFMAPEQRSNAKSVDARADVFSLGATLWAVLKGETPPELYAEDTAFDELPDALVGVLRTATRYRREERYASCQDLADALREALTRLPPDPELVAPLVLPPEQRQLAAAAAAIVDPAEDQYTQLLSDARAIGTMVPDHGPDPSLNITRVELNPAPRSPQPPPNDASPPPAPVDNATFDLPPPSRWKPVAALVGVVLLTAGVWFATRAGAPEPPAEVVAAPPSSPAHAAPASGPSTSGSNATEAPEPSPSAPAASAPDATAATPTAVRRATTAPPKPADSPDAAAVTVESTPPTPAPARVNQPPRPAPAETALVHNAPSTVARGSALTLTATGDASWTMKIYYRPATGIEYRNKTMTASGTTFSGTLRATDDLANGFEYFLQASTPSGLKKNGSATQPHRVSVE
jgi:serine/threonine-protein kinase